MAQTYYDILGVPPDADAATIKRAYYARMRQVHPDNFSAERLRMEAQRDRAGLDRLDRRIEEAKRQSQRLNQAYATLSDADRRARYDRDHLPRTAPPHHASLAPDEDEPRIYRARPQHMRTGKTVEERFPGAIVVVFILATLIISAGLSSFLRLPDYNVAPPTPDLDRIPAGSTDATATALARRPTATPRPLDSFVSAGDVLLKEGRYAYAIEQYSRALERSPTDAALYYRRGLAYRLAGQTQAALADFDEALRRNPTLVDAYRERGMVNLMTMATTAAQQNFDRYEALGGDMQHPDIVAALAQLAQD